MIIRNNDIFRFFWSLLILVQVSQACAIEPFNAIQTREFMLALAGFVDKNHLKNNGMSMQKGMIYEYRDMRHKNPPECFVQGEALDTMHDGAWLAAALVHARIASDDPLFRDLLEKNILPFYCRMLNHSHKVFSNQHNHARPQAQSIWKQNREWLLQDGEKGFVPYWWDDGNSVSLERLRDKTPLPAFPSFDQFVHDKKDNPKSRLSGYSLGSSNHLAQDLAVMLELSWLLYRNHEGNEGDCYRAELADAVRNLHECRMRHHGHIAMVDAAAGLALADPALLRHVPDGSKLEAKLLNNHYRQALTATDKEKKYPTPGFADDQEYRYYSALARHGTLPRATAFKLIYDAITEPRLYQYYCDDQPVLPGINRFDLHPISFVAGKPMDYRSDRKGPSGKPRPAGSRLGPQNMVVCGWGLQALAKWPSLWDDSIRQLFPGITRVCIHHASTALPEKWTTLHFQNQPLELLATPLQLSIRIPSPGNDLQLELSQEGKSQGCRLLFQEKTPQVLSLQGDKLLIKHHWIKSGDTSTLQVDIPFTVSKGQSPWINGVELEKYQVKVGGQSQDFILATEAIQVRSWMQRELASGLQTWKRIFEQKGYLPTGMEAGADWDHFSDSGAYAHLIHAGAQYLHLLSGKADWETLRLPELLAVPEK